MTKVESATQWPTAMLEQVQKLVQQGHVTPEQHGELSETFFRLEHLGAGPTETSEALRGFLNSRGLADALWKARTTESKHLEDNARRGLLDALDHLTRSANRTLATTNLQQRHAVDICSKEELVARRAQLLELAKSPDAQVLIRYIALKSTAPMRAGIRIGTGPGEPSIYLTGGGKFKKHLSDWLQPNAEQVRHISIDAVQQEMARLVENLANWAWPKVETWPDA